MAKQADQFIESLSLRGHCNMSSDTESRAYGNLRDLIEGRGGTMVYRRTGYRHGAWEISLGGKTVIVESMGNRSFPPLDKFYKLKPGVRVPKTWDDYSDELVEDAEAQLDALFSQQT